jgi:thymidylate synthase ThyX
MKIKILDNETPENTAMLQALYSRSSASVDDHLEKVKKTGSTRFTENFIVNYGHKSIADTSSTTIFIEGVSMLAAKAIQNNPLYCGQESSTRYIDFHKQPIVDPLNTPESRSILSDWMEFYNTNQDRVSGILCKRYPKRPDEKPETYAKAITARTFDVLRGFLPAGMTTQLSWHTNLRQAGDQLNWLAAHPLTEVRQIASNITAKLHERYPASGFDKGLANVSGVSNKDAEARADRKAWEAKVGEAYGYTIPTVSIKSDEVLIEVTNVQLKQIERYKDILLTRPRGCVLPHFLSDLGQYSYTFLLDYGSFRDIQRHRNGVCRMARLDTSYGFEKWYLEQLGDPTNDDTGGLRDAAVKLIHSQWPRIRNLANGHMDSESADLQQYYVAMGFQLPVQVTYSLPALVYVLELRSGKMIHPTLRQKIHAMIKQFKLFYSSDHVRLHVDMDPDDWDIRRGLQTITEK